MKKNSIIIFLKNNFDLLYLIAAIIILILDIVTISSIFEGLAFLMISIGFAFSVIPNKGNVKDERISYIKLFSGYTALMLSIISVSLINVLINYMDFIFKTTDILRYISELMFFFFFLIYVICKRKM